MQQSKSTPSIAYSIFLISLFFLLGVDVAQAADLLEHNQEESFHWLSFIFIAAAPVLVLLGWLKRSIAKRLFELSGQLRIN